MSEIGFKVTTKHGGLWVSAMVGDRPELCLTYAKGVDTVPTVGCCFLFSNAQAALDFTNHPDAVWECEYDPAPITHIVMCDYDDDIATITEFWHWLMAHPTEYPSGHESAPDYTVYATRVRPLRRIQ